MRAPILAPILAALLAPACLPTTDDAAVDAGPSQQQPPGGGTPVEGDGAVPPFGGLPAPADAGPDTGCERDEQCEPGYFCDDGTCEPVPDPECEQDEDCGDGRLCREGGCVDGPPPPGCESDGDCRGDEHCDASSGECLPGARCVRDNDCPETALCLGRLCSEPLAPCRTDRDCPEATICEEAACVHEPIPCETDRDCPADTICEAGNCLPGVPPCATDRDCPEGTVCEGGECIPEGPECREDTDCGGGEICDAGVCRPDLPPPECADDGDCDPGEVCVEGLCHPSDPGCVEDIDCEGDEICRDGACVPDLPECVDDGDCGPDEACRNNHCEPAPGCVTDDDCAGGDVCDAGRCVPPPPECVADRDCGPGEVCRAGACEPGAQPDCDADLDCAVGRVCVNGVCVLPAEPAWRVCNPRSANPGCAANALCLPIESCDPEAAACDGLCAPSTCDACTPGEACGGTAALCIPGRPAAFCITAGEAGLGEPCNWDEGLHCARGLTCTIGTCKQPCGGADCGAGSEACPAGETCLDLSSENGGRPFSICHRDCNIFTQRGCAAGEACRLGFAYDDTGVVVGACDDAAPSGRLVQNQVCMQGAHDWGNCRADHLCTDALTPDEAICFGFCTWDQMQNCLGASRCSLGVIEGFPALGVCVGNCDPWGGAPGCGAGETCQLATIGTLADGSDTYTGLCLPGAGSLAIGDTCEAVEGSLESDCVAGSICADIQGFFGPTCTQLCDTNEAEHGCPDGQVCTTQVFGTERPQGASPNLGVCQ